MKIAAVSQRRDYVGIRDEYRDSLDIRLVEFLLSVGVGVVPVPNSYGEESLLNNWLELIQPSIIILSGGNDLGEWRQRDVVELMLIMWAKKNEIPILGICRGMQMISTVFDGEIEAVDHHVGTRHTIIVDGIVQEVNSYHNFALKNCPIGFNVVAKSPDGRIEAFRHKSHFIEGWMWHPERERIYSENDKSRLIRLINKKIFEIEDSEVPGK
jgi:gamma-glutamyl-gamma-aminobutyrate hydrolase PuuD